MTLGSQRSVAGTTCEEILSKEDSAADGFYWLNSNGTEDPYVTFCNMEKEGGINKHVIVSTHRTGIIVSQAKETGVLCSLESDKLIIM